MGSGVFPGKGCKELSAGPKKEGKPNWNSIQILPLSSRSDLLRTANSSPDWATAWLDALGYPALDRYGGEKTVTSKAELATRKDSSRAQGQSLVFFGCFHQSS